MINELPPNTTPERTVEEIRDLLTSDDERFGRVATFIPAEEHTPESPPDGLSPLVKTGIEIIDEYLTRPMVLDKEGAFGGDHRQRRKWRADLPLDVRAVYENNALRRNLAGAALSAADYALYDTRDSEGRALKKERDNLREKFEKGFQVSEDSPDGVWTTEEKMTFIQKELKPFLRKVRDTAVGI